MYKVDFKNKINVHFLGIGGISMSSLAMILKNAGMNVSGSDIIEQDTTMMLESNGIKVFYTQTKNNINDKIDLVIYTASISNDNEELIECKRRKIPLLTRAELLGEIMNNYEESINIAGTHGKTTTTSLVSKILLDASLDPTITVGGMLPEINGNYRIGGTKYFVTEACEYTNSFLNFKPTSEIILDIEEDHLDFFKDIEDINNSFKKFINLVPKDGMVIINKDIKDYKKLVSESKAQIITYGLNEKADFYAKDIIFDNNAYPTFTLYNKNKKIDVFSLSIPGIHNVENSIAAIAFSIKKGISLDIIKNSLKDFHGAKRRFQLKGTLNGAFVFDDYAHHPSEIKATLNVTKNIKHNKLFVVFQPHTYTRTKNFLEDFGKALSMADVCILSPIYAAREKNTIGISSKDIIKFINNKTNSLYFNNFSDIENYLNNNVQKNDLVITMGAGNIYQIADNIVKKEKQNE
ncbi:MAG: UDP-N-acetylmuramate--L-alanine ligase [Eubacteriales bacterium]|nr:UDP-N-acetylmuramate--L-alanine ligase [Eubacteriales bacterium]